MTTFGKFYICWAHMLQIFSIHDDKKNKKLNSETSIFDISTETTHCE